MSHGPWGQSQCHMESNPAPRITNDQLPADCPIKGMHRHQVLGTTSAVHGLLAWAYHFHPDTFTLSQSTGILLEGLGSSKET